MEIHKYQPSPSILYTGFKYNTEECKESGNPTHCVNTFNKLHITVVRVCFRAEQQKNHIDIAAN